MNRIVVAKILISAGPQDETAGRVHRLLQAMGALSGHPNVATVYATGWLSHGDPYIIMEHLPGGSVAETLAKGPRLEWVAGTSIALKVAGALETAHRFGILHGDLKPEAILYSEYNEPKLIGFGSLNTRSPARGEVLIARTARNVAPEVLAGGPVTVAADVYGLAATTLELLGGSTSFGERASNEESAAAVQPVAVDVSASPRYKDVPEGVRAAIQWGMEADAGARPRSALEFAKALQAGRVRAGYAPITIALRGAAGAPDASTDPSAPLVVTTRAGRRRKGLIGLVVAVVGALAVALFLTNPFSAAVPASPLTRYFNSKTADRYETTLITAPRGYVAQATLGYLPTNDVHDGIAVYSCTYGADHFLSPDPLCEGYTLISRIGYVYGQRPSLPSAPLYRCWTSNHLDHFVSTDPYCEGQILYGFLGYILQNP